MRRVYIDKEDLDELKEKAENWDAFKGVVPSDSKLFVVKPEYAHMSRGDMATKLEAIKKIIDEVGPTTAVYRIRKILEEAPVDA